jgi:hypothetical protein
MRASNKKFTSPNLHIIGDNNTITGPNCTVTGDNNKLTGPNCTAHGNNNKLTGPNCTAHGDNNTLVGPNCKAHGRNNKVTGPSFEGGNYGVAQINVGGEDGFSTFSVGGVRFNNFAGGIGNVGDDGPVVVNMSAGGGMRIFKNGVEQEPFMVSKDSKKAKSKKRTAVEAEPEIKFIEGPSKADLANDKESGDGEATCIICLTNVPCCIATPCNHMSYCVSCARMLCFTNVEDESPKQVGQQACPKCKKQVEKITRVFN